MRKIEFSNDELFIIHAALNEICNALYIYDFEAEIGSSKEKALKLLDKLHNFLDENIENHK
jgi:hypothetical protein